MGIIDEDKNKGPMAKYFLEFDEIKSENDLILKKHKDRKQYLILICPEIEKWLLMNANSVHLDPSDFNLHSDLSGFKQITKTQNIDSNIEFYQFIKALIQKNAAGIITLRNWLNEFKNNTIHKS